MAEYEIANGATVDADALNDFVDFQSKENNKDEQRRPFLIGFGNSILLILANHGEIGSNYIYSERTNKKFESNCAVTQFLLS